MKVHAGVVAFLYLFGECVRRQGDDRHLSARADDRANMAGSFEPAHFRHADIHQNDVEIHHADSRNGFGPAFDADRAVTGRFEERSGDIAIHQDVVDHHHA